MIYENLLNEQVRLLVGNYLKKIMLEHFYKRTLKKTIRLLLFGVIQDSVDTIYFFEEDTISTANTILDNVVTGMVYQVSMEVLVTSGRASPQTVGFEFSDETGLTMMLEEDQNQQLSSSCDSARYRQMRNSPQVIQHNYEQIKNSKQKEGTIKSAGRTCLLKDEKDFSGNSTWLQCEEGNESSQVLKERRDESGMVLNGRSHRQVRATIQNNGFK